MLQSIILTNFKLYRKQTIFSGMSAINILTGINGRGKSTLLQAMLLPKQSLIETKWADRLTLNGKYVKLGNAKDVKNEKASRSSNIELEYKSSEGDIVLALNSEQDDSQKLDITEVIIDGKHYRDYEGALNGFTPYEEYKDKEISNIFRNFQYVSAERIGPQLSYPPSPEKDMLDASGEYAPCMIYTHSSDIISEDMLDGLKDIYPELTDDDITDVTLIGMLDFWMSEMFGKTSLSVRYLEDANVYVMNFGIGTSGNMYKPTNVGFGYSFVLPILVAGLLSPIGATLVVENPEAHLHPSAQSILGKFLAWVSKYGKAQVFVETHSEHIVNSFRVLVAQKIIANTDVNLLFFDNSFVDYAKQIEVKSDGGIDYWPKNFFDQEEKDLDYLLM